MCPAAHPPGRRGPRVQTKVLAKVVAHYLCVLIQACYELGIDPNVAPLPTAPAIAG